MSDYIDMYVETPRDMDTLIEESLDEAFLALSQAVKRVSQAPNLTATDLNILITAYNSLKNSTKNPSEDELYIIEKDIQAFKLRYNLPQEALKKD